MAGVDFLAVVSTIQLFAAGLPSESYPGYLTFVTFSLHALAPMNPAGIR